MAKNLIGLLKEIFSDFSIMGFLFNALPNKEDGADELVSYYRPISGRGTDQVRCLLAHIKTWRRTGNTLNYCEECPQYLAMTCMESSGYSCECRRGHYRHEAT